MNKCIIPVCKIVFLYIVYKYIKKILSRVELRFIKV